MTALPLFELVEPPPLASREQRIVDGFLACIDNENTLEAYRRDVQAFFEDCPSGLHVQVEELAAWIAGMREHGYAAKTIQRRMATVRGLLGYARDANVIDTLPAWKYLHLPKDTSAAVVRVLSVQEVKALIECAYSTARLPVRLALRTLYATGMRVAELLKMRQSNFYESNGKHWLKVAGKGGKVRDVCIPARLAENLLARCRAQREWGQCISYSLDVFPPELTASVLDKAIRAAAKRARIGKPVSAHWLRHSHITHALEAGCPWDEAATQAGHSSIAITQRVYAHLKRGKTSAEYLEEV